ncbi:Piso0_001936 [Millerozyma farinosa CBS 7064]|uniref:Piso0_001936 protein n=1 Tax=Pichia sorbitophila (strain ATCC MYA-4447 / BCRC 22081 / CBS 7064 / NBRC 10061 / NRRL Y-12695) TaxID=559304 RepID=G8YM35_PICSO|nr:Piso0_001936 [Millerozyma farinosa CBS 7064]
MFALCLYLPLSFLSTMPFAMTLSFLAPSDSAILATNRALDLQRINYRQPWRQIQPPIKVNTTFIGTIQSKKSAINSRGTPMLQRWPRPSRSRYNCPC